MQHYLLPMGASIWSARPDRMLRFPARFIITFFNNHGLLRVTGHPQWKTVESGAVRYVEALTRPFVDRIRLNTPVRRTHRRNNCVIVESERTTPESFDCVVPATHAAQRWAAATSVSKDPRGRPVQFAACSRLGNQGKNTLVVRWYSR